jgi:hypothetical protein
MAKFWELEQPEEIQGRYINWKLFPKAKILQITRVRIDRDGNERRRTVAVNRKDLTPDVVELLEKFMGE